MSWRVKWQARVEGRACLRAASRSGCLRRRCRLVFACTVLAQPADSISADENAVVIAWATAEDDALARLRTGEATSLVLPTATALGLASCPVTEPLEIADARAAVREDVFGGNEFPRCCCGSAGRRSTLIRYSRPRHDLSEVVEFVDGSPFH